MPPDFELFEVLRRHGVPFVIVGGHAVNFHGSEEALFRALSEIGAGFPVQDVRDLLATGVEAEGLRFASLDWLRRMKRAAGRPKDLLDLENLPE